MGEREMIERLHDVYGSLTPGAIDRADLDGMALTIKEAATTIASLSEALAEAEKKGAEAAIKVVVLDGLLTAQDVWFEYGSGFRVHFSFDHKTDWPWQADLHRLHSEARSAPPRDLSQGGQHG